MLCAPRPQEGRPRFLPPVPASRHDVTKPLGFRLCRPVLPRSDRGIGVVQLSPARVASGPGARRTGHLRIALPKTGGDMLTDTARPSARPCARHLHVRFQTGGGPPSEQGVRAGWAAVSQSPCGFLRHAWTPHTPASRFSAIDFFPCRVLADTHSHYFKSKNGCVLGSPRPGLTGLPSVAPWGGPPVAHEAPAPVLLASG